MSMNIWVEKKAEVGTEYRSWDGVGTEKGRCWDGVGPEKGWRKDGAQELGRRWAGVGTEKGRSSRVGTELPTGRATVEPGFLKGDTEYSL